MNERRIEERIYHTLKQCAETTKRSLKEEFLRDMIDDEIMQSVLIYALDSSITFGIQGEFKKTSFTDWSLNFFEIFKILDMLKDRECTGNAAKKLCQRTVDELSFEGASLFNRILNKDLRCGLSIKSVNKVAGKQLVNEFTVMKAHNDTSGIVYPAIAELKIDGARCTGKIKNESIEFLSSDGKKINLLNSELYESTINLARTYRHLGIGDYSGFFDGELVVIRNNKFCPREVSNGIINKAIKGTITPKEVSEVYYVIWDYVLESNTKIYEERTRNLDYLSEILSTKTFNIQDSRMNVSGLDFVRISDNLLLNCRKIVLNNEHAAQYFDDIINLGLEGIIEKNFDSLYEFKRTKAIGKRKGEFECDLKIVGFNPGNGKYSNLVGSVTLEELDGKLQVGVSGIDDETRQYITDNADELLGKVVTVKYNSVTQNKNTGICSLFLPRFESFAVRFDKSDADSLLDIVTISKQDINKFNVG